MWRRFEVILNKAVAIAGPEATIRNACAEQRDIDAGRRTAGQEILEVVEDDLTTGESVEIKVNVVAKELSADAQGIAPPAIGERVLRLPVLSD